MRVVAQRQTEMAEILGPVIGLRHRPQGRHVDEFVELAALGLLQQPVQVAGLQHLPLGQHQPGTQRDLAQRVQLFARRFFMDPEQQRCLALNQLLGGGDIRHHHEFLDHLVGVQPVAERDRRHLAVVVQHDLALGQVQVQRLAGLARDQCGLPRGEQVGQRPGQRQRRLIGLAVKPRLRLFIAQ